jgi:hypothetical protein
MIPVAHVSLSRLAVDVVAIRVVGGGEILGERNPG